MTGQPMVAVSGLYYSRTPLKAYPLVDGPGMPYEGLSYALWGVMPFQRYALRGVRLYHSLETNGNARDQRPSLEVFCSGHKTHKSSPLSWLHWKRTVQQEKLSTNAKLSSGVWVTQELEGSGDDSFRLNLRFYVEIVTGIFRHIPVLYIIYCLSTIIK